MLKSITNIRWTALLLSVLLLQGCGFHLRQAADLPESISPIIINGIGQHSDLGRKLAMRLKSDTVQVTTEREEAASMLNVTSYKRKNRTVSVSESGKVAQTELKHTLNFTLIDASGKILVPKQSIQVVREYINTDEQKLGKVTEAAQLTDGMHQELARKITTRIQAHLK